MYFFYFVHDEIHFGNIEYFKTSIFTLKLEPNIRGRSERYVIRILPNRKENEKNLRILLIRWVMVWFVWIQSACLSHFILLFDFEIEFLNYSNLNIKWQLIIIPVFDAHIVKPTTEFNLSIILPNTYIWSFLVFVTCKWEFRMKIQDLFYISGCFFSIVFYVR